LFDAHPEIACPGETYLLGACARLIRSERTPQGIEMGVVPGLSLLGIAEAEVQARLREWAFSFHRDHAKSKGKPRWAMKTAVDAFYIKDIERLIMGQAHVVAIVRNGLDVICSMDEMTKETGAFLSEIHEYAKLTPWPMEAYARAWSDISRALAGLASRHPQDVTLVRYEDLVSDPNQVFSMILERVGASQDDRLIGRALGSDTSVGLGDWKTYRQSSIHTDSIGRHHSLPEPAMIRLLPILEEEMRRHQYEITEVKVAANVKDSDRRVRLAMLLNMAKQDTES
jgi:hypothetical protein